MMAEWGGRELSWREIKFPLFMTGALSHRNGAGRSKNRADHREANHERMHFHGGLDARASHGLRWPHFHAHQLFSAISRMVPLMRAILYLVIDNRFMRAVTSP